MVKQPLRQPGDRCGAVSGMTYHIDARTREGQNHNRQRRQQELQAKQTQAVPAVLPCDTGEAAYNIAHIDFPWGRWL